MEKENGSEVEAIALLAQRAVAPVMNKREDGTAYAILNDGRVLEVSAVVPARKVGELTVADLASLVAYVAKHRGGGTLIMVAWNGQAVVVRAVLDHHAKDLAGWRGHVVEAKIQATPAWNAWLGNDRKELKQAAFAEWLEDRLGEVVTPAAAELMDVVRSLEASAGASFKGSVRLDNGDRAFAYQHTTEAKAGQGGELVIPSRIGIELALLRGTARQVVLARFKYRLTPDGLLLRYEIERRDEIAIEQVEKAAAALRDALPEIPVLLV
jgi:uncharacterized protein YfdQ (DUF2303 family)